MREYEDDISLEDTSRWLDAAMRLEKELDTDFKFNLAAFRQGVLTNMDALQQNHWPKVLRPSVSSLLSVQDDGYDLVKPRSNFEPAIQRMVEKAETLRDLLTRYERHLGHLPLHPELSIGAVVRAWLEDHPDEQVWEVVQEWVQGAPFSLRKLHMCQVALAMPDVIPEDQRKQFWSELAELLAPQLDGNGPSPIRAMLALEAALARHYFLYLECRTVAMDLDRLATVAWWSARLVTEVIVQHTGSLEDPEAAIERVREKSVEPELSITQTAWQMIHPRAGDASIRFATAYVRQPRILGLLLSMEDRIDQLPIGTLTAEHRDAITEEFGRYLLHCFPLETGTPQHAIWAFDSPLLRVAKQWADRLDAATVAEYGNLVAVAERLTDANQQWEILENLPHAKDVAQILVARFFHLLAHTSEDGGERLWGLVTNENWRNDCLRNLDQPALEALFTGIVELGRQAQGPSGLDLGHWFADVAETLELDKERRSWLFTMTVLASAATGTVSAIRRLAGGPIGSVLAEDVSYWRLHAEAIMPSAPPLLASRLRDILSSLPAD